MGFPFQRPFCNMVISEQETKGGHRERPSSRVSLVVLRYVAHPSAVHNNAVYYRRYTLCDLRKPLPFRPYTPAYPEHCEDARKQQRCFVCQVYVLSQQKAEVAGHGHSVHETGVVQQLLPNLQGTGGGGQEGRFVGGRWAEGWQSLGTGRWQPLCP